MCVPLQGYEAILPVASLNFPESYPRDSVRTAYRASSANSANKRRGESQTLNPAPQTLHPAPQTLKPESQTPNPETSNPETSKRESETRNQAHPAAGHGCIDPWYPQQARVRRQGGGPQPNSKRGHPLPEVTESATVAQINRSSTFALKRFTLDFFLGG